MEGPRRIAASLHRRTAAVIRGRDATRADAARAGETPREQPPCEHVLLAPAQEHGVGKPQREQFDCHRRPSDPHRHARLREKLKQHWLVSILLLCAAVAGETWQIAQEVLVAPRNFQIAQLQEELQNLKTATPANRAHSEKENPLVLEETGVFEGNAITTRDGRCSIRINRVSGDRISLSVAIDALKPVIFESQKPGDRVPVDAGDQTYYVNIHRVRGSIVDLAVYQRRK